MHRALALVTLLLAGCVSTTASASVAPSVAPSVTPSVAPSASASVMASLPEPIPHELAAEVNAELREELLEMKALDQSVRTGVPLPGDDRTAEELMGAMAVVDAEHTVRMREILDAFGWPGWSLVGRDGSEAAWVLVQHADLTPDFQELALAYLRGAVEADDASPGDLAYLTDRVLVARGMPQLYGTQLGVDPDGELIPRTPIEDEANVDARRAAAGLGTLEEYFEEFRRAMEEEASPSAEADS